MRHVFVHNTYVQTVDVAKLVSFVTKNLLIMSTLNLKCLQKCILDNDVILEDVDVISDTEDVVIVFVVCIEGEGMPEICFHVI